ncbi:fimbria/pilus periplasmic chaperone [Sphingopyxis sp.]|uniref:fimbrial biogenesis chaperone n=1 Tax=Sphingopyxis sp. TaxID=1908224 RepID=UPI001DD7862C|nr:fimbria/pilus periplasmic chaperone [Sphingopyxis sp.]MBW8296716.1 fimbria/pilus periplasmic chaperone [Sphingopyxis sp.]
MRQLYSAFAAFLIAVAAIVPATAVDVQPVINVIRLPQDARGISVAISNPRRVPLPVTFDIVEREIELDGSEKTKAADEEFVIFPPQAVLQPGETQAVRIQFVGDTPTMSRSFTMFTTEVPVDLESSGLSGVQRILRIGASIHVAPQGTAPKPVIASAVSEGSGTRIVIRNEGNRFVYLDNISLRFDETVVEGYELANIGGRTLIPPGASRSILVPNVAGEPTVRLLPPIL